MAKQIKKAAVKKSTKPARKPTPTKVVKKAASPKIPPKTKQIKKASQKKQTKTVTSSKKVIPVKRISKVPTKSSSAKAKVPGPAPKSRVPKVPKAESGPKGYNKDQYEKYKAEIFRLNKLGNNELKAILKKNMQSMSGNKDELVVKIADGIILGRIPRCPSCFGGRYDIR
jgi:hypothetical protein